MFGRLKVGVMLRHSKHAGKAFTLTLRVPQGDSTLNIVRKIQKGG